MVFSEKVKTLAKQKSSFRCCICYKPFVQVHHIIPESENGTDTIENAAPLCTSCHDLYGGNPEKRKLIRQMRDQWWSLMEERSKNVTESQEFEKYCEIVEDSDHKGKLKNRPVFLYHVVWADENFDTSVTYIQDLIRATQESHPNQKRVLFLDIEGHRNKDGSFDHDMFELQRHFLLGFMFQFLSELYMPIAHVKNNKAQLNKVPEQIEVIETMDQETVNKLIDEGTTGIWVADKDKLLKID